MLCGIILARLANSGAFDSPFNILPQPDLNEIRQRVEAVVPSMIERRKLYWSKGLVGRAIPTHMG